MSKVLIFPNMDKAGVSQTLREIIKKLSACGREIILPEQVAWLYKNEYTVHILEKDLEGCVAEVEFALALGGDGTLLRLLKYIAPYNIPLCGINFGKLGFLAELDLCGLDEKLDLILSGNYQLEKRSMLQAELCREGRVESIEHALNDIVITCGSTTQLIHLYAKFPNGGKIKYPVDGLIFATPTGSTAYSLSAGGPIVDPSLDAFLLTPICSHALYTRPLVVGLSERVHIEQAFEDEEACLLADGRIFAVMRYGDELHISRSAHTVAFIRLAVPDHYVTWQEKLRRGEESAKF